VHSLWQSLPRSGNSIIGTFSDPSGSVDLRALESGTTLEDIESLRGKSVLLATGTQLASALALIELDGLARRIVLCTPDLTADQLKAVAATAEAEAMVVDATSPHASFPLRQVISSAPSLRKSSAVRSGTLPTEWILLTSGTTGIPKLVAHDFQSLAGALPRNSSTNSSQVWSTFYDIRRYGGLQIYLRAVVSGSSLVLSSAGESTHDFLQRAGAHGVTNISGTPSHWRKALMSGDAKLMDPHYVRLSGEVADQTILDGLKSVYPKARVAHAFASTEAGVAFDVNDGLAGFPATLIEQSKGTTELKVQDGTLWIRSGRLAARYLGMESPALVQSDGFVDTGDMIELSNGRYHFRGRRGGVINVGGLKVYPEEVEAVLNGDSRVKMSLVKAKRNPITGAVLVAEIVLNAGPEIDADTAETVKSELLSRCRSHLAAHKIPALLRFVPTLELSAAGKLVRPNA
jgi:acyl-coenzyme A synthetase/AMP-(fatty) acid ligase